MLVGKVCMDQNGGGNGYEEESAEVSLEETASFVKQVLELDCRRVLPILTPRFAPSCTEELLSGLGELAASGGRNGGMLHVQSHISESRAEIAWVADLFPSSSNYADVYAAAGLLTRKTIMAHGCFLTPDELEVFAKARTGISHCPASNFGLSSGILNVLDLEQYDIDVGLGSDVAGGAQTCILDAMRNALIASKVLTMPLHAANGRAPNTHPLTVENVFYMATMGGARVLDMQNTIGSFAVGKAFDAIFVSPSCPGSPVDLFSTDTELRGVLEKYVMLGDDRNHAAVFVDGDCVYAAPYANLQGSSSAVSAVVGSGAVGAGMGVRIATALSYVAAFSALFLFAK